MIQRIQTVYLLLAVLAAIFFLFLPFGSIQTSTGAVSVTGSQDIIMIILSGITALVAFIAIFLFKNRPLQSKIVNAGIVICFLLIAYTAYKIWSLIPQTFTLGPAIGFPVFTLIFLFLAHRSIKHDENLVRSMDRLR